MTPAAPPSITPRASERMAAKPGAETPTMTGTLARRTTWLAIARASAAIELGRFAHDAENGEAGDAAGQIEVGHAVDGGGIDCAIGRERRDGDGEDAFCGVVEKH